MEIPKKYQEKHNRILSDVARCYFALFVLITVWCFFKGNPYAPVVIHAWIGVAFCVPMLIHNLLPNKQKYQAPLWMIVIWPVFLTYTVYVLISGEWRE